jgi:alpha,alpha-trehalase
MQGWHWWFASRLLALVLAIPASVACSPATPGNVRTPSAALVVELPQTPDEAYPELFQAVQQQWLFADQKEFVDALPRQPPARIRAAYLAARDAPDFRLAAFVATHFDSADTPPQTAIAADTTLSEHIDALWPALTRHHPREPAYSSRLPLPYPYVVPGGRFREIYYWDSYFTMLGLVESGQHTLARQMLDNFAHLIDTYGHIPNGNRSYYLSRSQPPFFSHMVELDARVHGPERYGHYLPQLQQEHAFWMDGAQTLAAGSAHRRVVRLADGRLLNRYWDDRDTPRPESWMQDRETAVQAVDRPANEIYRELRAGAESGWDYSTRWLGDRRQLHSIRTTAILPVDLNSLLYHLEMTLARACQLPPAGQCRHDYPALAQQRRDAIETYLWHEDGYYTDYDWRQSLRSDQVTAAGLYPLFTGLASGPRAAQSAMTVRNHLLAPGGLLTTALDSGQQWDAPNAWAPLQWIAVDGLRRYGQDDLAASVGTRFLGHVQQLFDVEHRLLEKYDARSGAGGGGGEYPLQDGFGWTNGVTRMLLKLYPQTPPATRPPQ